MKIIITVLICLAAFFEPLLSKTPEQRTLSNLKYAIELYRTERNDIPKDWASMEEFGFKTTLDEAREILDVENRYMFPNLNTVFSSGSHSGKRIVLMARKAGEEGAIKIYDDEESFQAVDGRFVIFETVESGKIDSGRISEAELRTLFEKEGLRLADFTFDAPPKPEPKVKPYRMPDSIRRPGDPPNLWETNSSRQEKKWKPSRPEHSENHQDSSMGTWKSPLIVAVSLSALFLLIMRMKSTHQQGTK